jgi:hypothetical protein
VWGGVLNKGQNSDDELNNPGDEFFGRTGNQIHPLKTPKCQLARNGIQ